MMRFSAVVAVLSALAVAACGGDEKPRDPGPAAVTTLDPQPGNFVTSLTVTLTSDQPATILLTTDGTDPRTGENRQVLTSPATVTLEKTTTLSFYSHTTAGADEPIRQATYTRVNYAAGAVVVGSIAVGRHIGLVFDGREIDLGLAEKEGELPFLVDAVGNGSHSVKAYADRDGNGKFTAAFDPESQPVDFLIGSDHLLQEYLTLLLGVSRDGFGTLKGEVNFSKPVDNVGLIVTAADPAFFSGTAFDPGSLELNRSFQTKTTATDLRYPFVVTDLVPGSYVPLAIVTSQDSSTLNLVFKAFPQIDIAANDAESATFQYGSSPLHGTVTLHLSRPVSSGTLVRCTVFARSGNAFGTQVLVMPTPLEAVSGSTTQYKGSFSARALRDSETFQLKVFTTFDGSSPLSHAGQWVIDGGVADGSVVASEGATVDLSVNVAVP